MTKDSEPNEGNLLLRLHCIFNIILLCFLCIIFPFVYSLSLNRNAFHPARILSGNQATKMILLTS
jgi:hypothetical protein